MSIKFFCPCGKHLRAREALAGKRTVCPACGQLIGVPGLGPTQRGTSSAPMSPTEKARLGRPASAAVVEANAAIERDHADEAGSPKRWRRSRRLLALERHWYQCLAFPFYAAQFILPLSLALTALTGVGLLAIAELNDAEGPPAWVLWVCSSVPLATVIYLCGFLQSVLASGAAGETGFVRWPGADLGFLFWSLAAWIVCFLAGPIVFGAAAFTFWFVAGDLTILDWVIVVEMAVVGAGHWLLALVAVHQGDRLRDANPLRVGDLVRRLGAGAVLATFGVVLVGLALGTLILLAGEWLHSEPVHGWPLLFLSWLGLLAWLTFAFRLLGIWCFQSRVETWEAPLSPSRKPEAAPRPAGVSERGAGANS